MPQIPGYHGCYLRIDLSTGRSTSVALEERWLRKYIGGSGLGVALMLKEGAATVDALASEAALAFVFSPLVGSPLTTSAKFAVVSKSPLTHRINDSMASSGFAMAGKKTGFDAIVLLGRAESPSILVIEDQSIRLESAEELVGCTNSEAEQSSAAVGVRFQTATIGPAGEKLVRYATISHDGRHAGRGGSGAVMGSKNIKAIAVRGTQRVHWSDPPSLVRLSKALSEKSFGPATAKYRELGTASNLLTFNRLNVLPTCNFQQGSFAGADAIAPEAFQVVRDRTRSSCAACTIGCEHLYRLKEGGEMVRLEYENLFALGPLCGIDDPDIVLEASRVCDEAGLDTISAGGTIAFAMECAERGWLDAPWLRLGNGQALLKALQLIVGGQGLGRLLAMGSRGMALEIGHDSISIAPQVKGLELPGYDPRGLQMMALGFAVGSRGADHNRSGAYELDFSEQVDRRNVGPESVHLAVETEDKAALMDSLILCKFLRGVFIDFFVESAEILQLVTGWDMTANELRQVAQRIVTAKKYFNILAGWTPSEDTLPARMLQQALPEDARSRLSADRLSMLVKAYNLARGWSQEGWLPESLISDYNFTQDAPNG